MTTQIAYVGGGAVKGEGKANILRVLLVTPHVSGYIRSLVKLTKL